MNKLNKKQFAEVVEKLAKLGRNDSIADVQKLTQSEINEIDDAVKKVDSFNALWGKVELRLGEPHMWTEWRQSTGLLNSCLKDHRMVLKESFVKYCDFKSDELYDISCVGTYDTDYPIIFFANIVNGEIIGNWVQPHTFYDYWSFRDSIIIDTGSIPDIYLERKSSMPLVLCSIGLPEVFEQNRESDTLHSNLWLYCRDLLEEDAEDMEDASLYAEGGIG